MMTIRFDDLDGETAAMVESALPATAAVFVHLLGLPAALAFIAEFGGMKLRFPLSLNGPGGEQFARFAEVVGVDSAERLGQWFRGGDYVYIPLASRAMAALRNRQMTADYCRLLRTMGARRAVNSLVSAYRMSDNAIEKIVNGKERKPRAKSPTEAR